MESWERQTSLDDQQIRFSAPNCGEYFPIQSCNAFRTDLRKYHQFGLQEPMKCSDGHSSAYLHSSVFVSSQLCIEGVFSAQLLRRQSVSDRFAWIFEIWIVFFGFFIPEKTSKNATESAIKIFGQLSMVYLWGSGSDLSESVPSLRFRLHKLSPSIAFLIVFFLMNFDPIIEFF